MKAPTTKEKELSSFLILSEITELNKLELGKLSGEELGIIFLIAELKNDEFLKSEVANQIFETL